MNADVKKKWVEALRSGEFHQGQGVLRHENTYCCLGVLCELYRRETGDGAWNNETHVAGGHRFATDKDRYGDGSLMIPPAPVVQWAGMSAPNPAVLVGSLGTGLHSYTLADLNDSGRSFAEIANIIEARL